ncbi:hypothetical protein ACFPVS_11390 [Neisseria weixii]|uniref:Uncharacterized protein n=1 Tax=Neisseria weixii TaxID=1853276 RepID=A0A3N4MIE5_9NEIS|nr:hypothetical protein CGZ65_10255 [Neisseria weixii]RPD82968.1 hypothetical protein EGK74_13995 [Neisseria weixii]RPD83063.1 hypothetical protein EGK75_13960 [Neisseria weixii]
MFYISEEELKFKKDTNPEYLNEKLCHVFMNELSKLNETYPIDDFTSIVKKSAQFYLNRTYLDDMVVFFEDGSLLKFKFLSNGFECEEHYDSEISTAFYYSRYSIRV